MTSPETKPTFHPASAPDFVPAPLLRKLQLDRLQAIVGHAYERVVLFRERLQSRKVTPADIQALGDVVKLPFTTKADLRDTYPFGLFVLLEVEGTLPHYQIILTREHGLDQIEVQVEVTPQVFSDRVGALEALAEKIMDTIERAVGIRIKVTLVEPQTIQRSEGKAKRVIDKRGQS